MPVTGVGVCVRSVPAACVAPGAPGMMLLVSTAMGNANMPRGTGISSDPFLQVHVLKSPRIGQEAIRQLEALKEDKRKLLDAFRSYIEDPDYRSANHPAVLELLEQVCTTPKYLLCRTSSDLPEDVVEPSIRKEKQLWPSPRVPAR